jgi:hypothetical protein
MEISGFVPLSVDANQVLAVSATTGNVQLTNVGEHVTANVMLWNSGPNIAHMNWGASAGTSCSLGGGFIVPASSFLTLERPPGAVWLSGIASATNTAGMYITTGFGAGFPSK